MAFKMQGSPVLAMPFWKNPELCRSCARVWNLAMGKALHASNILGNLKAQSACGALLGGRLCSISLSGLSGTLTLKSEFSMFIASFGALTGVQSAAGVPCSQELHAIDRCLSILCPAPKIPEVMRLCDAPCEMTKGCLKASREDRHHLRLSLKLLKSLWNGKEWKTPCLVKFGVEDFPG